MPEFKVWPAGLDDGETPYVVRASLAQDAVLYFARLARTT